jgi:hypothetical protein
MKNPFSTRDGCAWIDGDSRMYAMKSFSEAECRAALELTDLQKTVRLAI